MTGIAIIGRGAMGRTHAAAWSELGLRDNIRYVCAPQAGTPLPAAPGARWVSELDLVLADADVDVISVCTPTATHSDIAIRALQAGKNVLLEKPIALNRVDAERILKVAADSSGTFMVAHVVRFFDGYARLRRTVRAGTLGEIHSVRAVRMSPPPVAPWILDESASGGALVDFAIHDFDQLNLFLGTPVTVSARPGERAGSIVSSVRYASGVEGEVLTNASLPRRETFMSSLQVDGALGTEDYTYPDDTPDSPFARQAEYFLECVRGGLAPEFCPPESAVLALDVAIAARTSLKTGRTVRVS